MTESILHEDGIISEIASEMTNELTIDAVLSHANGLSRNVLQTVKTQTSCHISFVVSDQGLHCYSPVPITFVLYHSKQVIPKPDAIISA